MRIRLKNIGKIKEADVEINGVTVIAGENNTGKSTVGKALWSVFNSFVDFKNRNFEKKVNLLADYLWKNVSLIIEEGNTTSRKSSKLVREIAIHIVKELTGRDRASADYKEVIQRNLRVEHYAIDLAFPSQEFEKLCYVLARTRREDLDEFLWSVFDAEFNGDALNSYLDVEQGDIQLFVKDNEVNLKIVDDAIFCDKEIGDFYVSATYIDDPFAVDLLNEDSGNIETPLTHKADMLKKLRQGKPKEYVPGAGFTKERLKQIDAILDSVCSKGIEGNDRTGYFYELENGYPMDVRSLSTGLKSFVVLKRLIQNGVIAYGGTLILDEPEVHLHPSWQLKFAEAIILLQKEFDLHILVNTHSPYFLEAIETYSALYKKEDICKYYLAKNNGEHCSLIKDVTNDIDLVYRTLAKPLNDLDKIYYAD